MKIGVLTAALQELTPREKRDPDPDLAIEEWVAFAREIGADHIQLSAALHPSEGRRAGRGHARPGGQHARPPQALRPRAGEAGQGGDEGARRRPLRPRLLRQHAPRGRGDPEEEARLHAAGHGRRRPPRGGRGLRLRRPQPGPLDGREPPRLREDLRPAPEVREGAAARLPRRAVPDAGLDHEGQLAQQHRLHAGDLDRPAPDLREARRGRQLPHPLRPLARDPDGPGHPVDLPVPEGRGLRLPDRRLPREGPGDRREGRRRPGATAARPWSAATGRRAGPRRGPPTSSTPGRSRSSSASTSCRARRGTTRWPTCRTARWTGSTTSWRRASC